MTTNWIEHPGSYIKEEMEARAWIQRDLAFILGIPEQGLNLILAGKRGISPEMAKALGQAFDVPAQFFANLQQAYDLSQAKEPNPEIAVLGKMHTSYPVREMIKRGWLEKTDVHMLEQQLARFFCVPSVAEVPYMPHAAKKSSYEERDVHPAQLAWLFRVRQIAKSISVPKYSERSLRAGIHKLEPLMLAPEGAREVPRLLMEWGIKFIVVEKLPNAKIDGVCFWENDTPVVGMSTQRDTIDNFWFVLRHELEHVVLGHGREMEMIDIDVQGANVSEEESLANAAALEFSVSPKFESFFIRKRPFYYEKDVIAFSRTINRHPGIIVGQMQRRLENYSYLTRHLAKIRQFVLPGAIADGWGQVLPIAL
jgi:HTH-type transcriptional regulator/antitoxin HigA